jgi:xylulokinase
MSDTLLGLDIGSSSVKVSLLESNSGRIIAHATSPSQEMEILSPQPGWAEQHPDLWWEHVCNCLCKLKKNNPSELAATKAIGIAYQMHGLVLVDREGKPVRPAIIWCDSRAVEVGDSAFKALGEDTCLSRLGNSPGNFTASKLAWVLQKEPGTLAKAAYAMLPGDYIAFKLTGRFGTTPSGLSEGILWDFQRSEPALFLLKHFGIAPTLIPPVSGNCAMFDQVRADVASELGLPKGAVVSYRAGDQPNNALALNVLNPGEIGANAGTSGVIYGVTDKLGVDRQSRVNNFLHVNSTEERTRIGVLMCVNGTGSFYRWLKGTIAPGLSYQEINTLAERAPIGAQGISALPYGNGAERTLGNKVVGASLENLDLNRHTQRDIFRAGQEGIVFALAYGLEIMRSMNLTPTLVRAGLANMFQSDLFQRTFATTTGVPVELLTTDGSEGAARAAGIGAGLYTFSNAFVGLTRHAVVEPEAAAKEATQDAYGRWKEALGRHLGT